MRKACRLLICLLLIMQLGWMAGAEVLAGGVYENDRYIRLQRTLNPYDTVRNVGGTQDIRYYLHGDEFTILPENIDEEYLVEKDIVLVIDVSGSMGEALGQSTRMQVLKDAANSFIDQFKYKKAKIGIIPFSTNADTGYDFVSTENSSGINSLHGIINGLRANGGTNTGDGMRRAYWMLRNKAAAGASKHVIVMTDGEPTYWTRAANGSSSYKTNDGSAAYNGGTGNSDNDGKALGYATTIGQMIADGNINPYVIGFTTSGASETKLENIALSCKAAEVTKGRHYYTAKTAVDIRDVYNHIGTQILNELQMIGNAAYTETFPEGVEITGLPQGFTSRLENGRTKVTGPLEGLTLKKNDNGLFQLIPREFSIQVKYTSKGLKEFNNLSMQYTDPFNNIKAAVIENELAVLVRQPVRGVSVAPAEKLLNKGETFTPTATVTPADADNQAVTWSSSDPAVAAVDQDGTVTAVKTGTATITVRTEEGGFTDTCAVTVKTPVTGVTVAPKALYFYKGQSYTLTATVTPADADNRAVTWSSSDPGVATVDSTGKVTAVKSGLATITVTTVDGRFTDTCEATVRTPVAGVTVAPKEKKLIKGETFTPAATVAPADADNRAVTWSSSDPEVAAVDESGTVTAVRSGTATITVTTEEGGFTDTCAVTVHNPITAVEITDRPAVNPLTGVSHLGIWKKYVFQAGVLPEDTDDNKEVEWFTEDGSVLEIDRDTGEATARRNGTVTVTVRSKARPSVFTTCTVQVSNLVDIN